MMKKQQYKCKHKLLLLKRYFTIIDGSYFYVTLHRCYKCREIIQEEMPVSTDEVNRYSFIELRLNKGDDCSVINK